MNDLVSIITATYNDSQYLEECIASVLDQEHTNWEWIIVNNGSTDSTRTILNRVKDPRIRLIHLDSNVGVSSGRNEGLKNAKGSYLCFLDGDDVIPSCSISSRLNVFQSDDEICFVDGKVLTFRGQNETIIDQYVPSFRGKPLSRFISMDGSVFRGNTWMIKHNNLSELSFRSNLTHGEDFMFYMDIIDIGLYDFTLDPVLKYRKTDHSAMSNTDGELRGYIYMVKELRKLNLHSEQIRIFKAKTSSIIFKSFLKKGWPIKALVGAFRIYSS